MLLQRNVIFFEILFIQSALFNFVFQHFFRKGNLKDLLNIFFFSLVISSLLQILPFLLYTGEREKEI